jgi:hypothetical protein
VIASLAFFGYTEVVHTIIKTRRAMSNIFKKLKNWTFDMFLYLIEVIDFFAKKKEQQCKTDM